MSLDVDTAKSLIDLLRELASELDLHYNDDELPAIGPTMKVMERAVRTLQRDGFSPPEPYLHMVQRFATAGMSKQ